MSSLSTTENARSPLDADPLAEARALIESGKPGDAVRLLESLNAEGRGGLLLQAERVRAMIAVGDPQSALTVARETALLYPSVATAAVALGEASLAAGQLSTAIGEFQRALRLAPESIEARYGLGTAWLEAGEAEKADEAFAALAPDEAPAGLAEKRGEIAHMKARPRSDARYVRHLFDQFSADYDARMLGQLGYGAPQILRELAELIGLSARGALAILDLGCGTGLSGAAFRDLAARLDGIDLSPAMVAKARAREIYDDVRVADIETAPAQGDRLYDLIVAADTLVYLGDLAPVLRAAAQRLAPGGMFLFTVERGDGEGFALGPKRRWRHSENYLRGAAEAAGFVVNGFLECVPRTEAGQPVAGYAVAFEKQHAS